MSLKIMQQEFLWKRFYDASIESYVGAVDEPILDMRSGVFIIRLCDGVTPGGWPVNSEVVPGINTPAILSPINNAVDIVTSPIITCGAFEGISDALVNDTHASSKWQISTSATFTTILHDSGFSATRLTVHNLSTIPLTLASNTIYYVRVMHKGASGLESEWSTGVKFTTDNGIPDALRVTLTASDGLINDLGGEYGVQISANKSTVAFTARGEDTTASSSGAAYVFTQSSGIWSQQAKLKSPLPEVDGYFGSGIALSDDGNRIAVGADGETASGLAKAGRVHIFTRSGTTWSHLAVINPPVPQANARFGSSVDISGDGNYLVIGDVSSDLSGVQNTGAAHIYLWNGSTYVFQATVVSDILEATSQFGYSVALDYDGNSLVVSQPWVSTDIGRIHFFTRSGVTWTRQSSLAPSDGVTYDYFGQAVAISGDGNTVFAASRFKTVGATSNAGACYVFARSGNTIAQQAKLVEPVVGTHFGHAIATTSNGNTIVVGKLSSTKLYLFTRSGVTWSLLSTLQPSPSMSLGDSVAISNDGTVVVSGDNNIKNPGDVRAGGVAVF